MSMPAAHIPNPVQARAHARTMVARWELALSIRAYLAWTAS